MTPRGGCRARSSSLVLLHLRHHRPTEGGRADAWADAVRHLQPSVRPDARHHRARRVPRGRAAVARRRRARAAAGGARRGDACCCRANGWTARKPGALVERHRVTNMFTVPTILTMLARHEAVDRYDHSSLRYVIYAGAPMYRADQRFALEKLGPVLVQYFGMGEVTGNITVLPPRLAQHRRRCDAGRQLRLPAHRHGGGDPRTRRHPPAAPAAPARSACAARRVFAGYYNNPEANGSRLAVRLVPHRRPRSPGRARLGLHHRPRVGHVHLRRIERVSARDRGGAADRIRRSRKPASSACRIRNGARAASPCWCCAEDVTESRTVFAPPGRQPGEIQMADALRGLVRAAEIRLRQGDQARGETPAAGGDRLMADSPNTPAAITD